MPANLENRGGTWHLRVVIGGKLYRKTTGFSDKERAKRRARQIENEIREGRFGWKKSEIPAFKAYVVTFLSAHYPGKYPAKHWLAPLVERWGARKIDTITASDVQQYFRDMEADKYAGATIERTRVLVNRLFDAAISDKIIESNPLGGIKRFKANTRTRVITDAQEALLRTVLRPTWDRYLTVALGTGLRAGEQRMARPMDRRHNGTWVWVRPESNKTRTEREVPLTPEVIKALEDQEASRKGDTTVPFWPVSASTANRVIERACKKLEISPAFSPHDFRRTFATRCAAKKMYPKVLQAIMGHKDIRITMEIYAQLEQASVRDALLEIGK